MGQSLENKFNSNGSRLGYPNNPSQPNAALSGPSVEAQLSTLHDLYSYDGNPLASDVDPRFANVNKKSGVAPLPEPTQLQAFTGPKNDLASGAGFTQYNNQKTYDDHILNQGATDGVDRLTGRGDAFLR
jgi:hypothetical protein|tara:strand:+ start:2592 stop:2978 length:387 start_codon:yes stop_codon:yes gene_type:complete